MSKLLIPKTVNEQAALDAVAQRRIEVREELDHREDAAKRDLEKAARWPLNSNRRRKKEAEANRILRAVAAERLRLGL